MGTIRFKDGLYKSIQDFQRDQPVVTLKDIAIVAAINPRTLIAQVESIERKASGYQLDPNDFWGLSLNGRPFIRVPNDKLGKSLPTFAGLSVIGKICYFSYDEVSVEEIELKVYNPETGRPFRKGTIDSEKRVTIHRMINFYTGEIAPLDQETLLGWIGRDEKVLRQVRRIQDNDTEQLIRAIMMYNDN